MVWPQGCDGKGNEGELAKSYNIHAISQLFFVNKQGVVLVSTKARGRLGEAVEKLLAE